MARPTAVVLIPIRFPLVKQGQNLAHVVEGAIGKQNLRLKNGDVLTVASKIVSLCENRVLKLSEVRVSARAKRLAKRWEMDGRLSSIVLHEADLVLGGVKGFMLTVKDGTLTANAGVDLKNSPHGTVTLWPENPDKSAARLRQHLERQGASRLAVEIVDSRITPLRLGTVGLAIGVSGFRPVVDERTKTDLYGRRISFTQLNIADDLAASAHMLMGERKERVGAVVLRGLPLGFDVSTDSSRAKLEPRRCLITSTLM